MIKALKYNRKRNFLDKQLDDYERLREFRHDYNNHINAVIGFLDMDMGDKAKEYLLLLSDDITHDYNISKTESDIIHILVGRNIHRAKKKGIDIKADIKIDSLPSISDLDINRILENALDNAIEASDRCEGDNRYISIRINSDKQLYIDIINGVHPDYVNNNGYSTKNLGGLKHGLGLSIIKKTVKKYGGDISAKYDNGEFVLHIVI